jgi:hypothetical protein
MLLGSLGVTEKAFKINAMQAKWWVKHLNLFVVYILHRSSLIFCTPVQSATDVNTRSVQAQKTNRNLY